jgi:SAM-dependent methyltransferase
MTDKQHWEKVYASKAVDAVSWFQPHPELSLALIWRTGSPPDAPIIDVGAGASSLVDDLLARGYQRVSVLDISGAALAHAQTRLGDRAAAVTWIEGDIRDVALPEAGYQVWHDRAVFHFLTGAADRRAYVDQVLDALRPGGHLIVATFGPDGPSECSGLPVARYAPEALAAEFGDAFRLVEQAGEAHRTPAGKVQHFVYCRFRIEPGG